MLTFKEKTINLETDLKNGCSVSCVGINALNYPLRGGNYFSMYIGDSRDESCNILNMSYENYKYITNKLDIKEVTLLEVFVDDETTYGHIIVNDDIPREYYLGCLWLYGTQNITEDVQEEIIDYLKSNEFGIRPDKEPELTDDEYKEEFKKMMAEKFDRYPVHFTYTTDVPLASDIAESYSYENNRQFLELIKGNNYMWVNDALNMGRVTQENFLSTHIGELVPTRESETSRKVISLTINIYDTPESLEAQKYHVDFDRGMKETKKKLMDLTEDGLRHIYKFLKENPSPR